MAISYVGGQTNFILGSTTADATITFALTGGTDATPLNGDLVVICVAASRAGPAGVTSLIGGSYTSTTQLTANDAQDSASQVHYKFMGGTPDTTFTVTRSGDTASGQAWTVHVFRGVDSTTPLDTTTTTATGLDTGRPNPAAITPVTTGAWIYIGTGCAAANGVGATFTYSAFTAVLTTLCDETTNEAVVGSGYYDAWTSGAYDPAASTTGPTSVNSSWTATTMAFRPLLSSCPVSITPVATLTWGGRSTASSNFDQDGTGAVTWNGRSTAAAAFDQDAVALLQWRGTQLWSAAATITCTASVTWNGAYVMAGAFDSDAIALLTWNGRSTAGAGWSSVNAASLTWNGAASAASAFDQDATASLTWNGTGLYPSALSVIAAASVTWNGAEVSDGAVSGDWASAAAASLTWNGESSATSALSSTAVSSVTWNGTGLFPGAASIAATASLTWNGTGIASADWSAATTSSVTWNGAAFAASSLNSPALASLTWNGIAIASGAWSSDATALLIWIGEANGAPTTSDAAWNSTATALAAFASSTIAAAGFSMGATAGLRWVSPVVRVKNLGGSGDKKDMDEEDLPFIAAAVRAFMEQNNDNY